MAGKSVRNRRAGVDQNLNGEHGQERHDHFGRQHQILIAMKLSFLAMIVISFWISPASSRAVGVHPISVRIAAIRGKGFSSGNVKVTLSNGNTELWTTSGHCSLPHLSKSGLLGWTHATGRHSRGMWMNDILRVARSGKVIREISGKRAFIENWEFSNDDACVIVESINIHGSSLIQKVCISTGELLAEGSERSDDSNWGAIFDRYAKMQQQCISSLRADNKHYNPWDSRLFAAVKAIDYVKVQEALGHGASVNARDKDDQTPLLLVGTDLRMADLLLDHGADPNLADKEGTAPILLCQKDSDLDMAALLVKHGADIKRTSPAGQGPLIWAAWHGQLEMVKYLVEHGVDVSAGDNFGQTPLGFAEKRGQDAIVTYLKDHRAGEK
jgi:hypothetical protein